MRTFQLHIRYFLIKYFQKHVLFEFYYGNVQMKWPSDDRKWPLMTFEIHEDHIFIILRNKNWVLADP